MRTEADAEEGAGEAPQLCGAQPALRGVVAWVGQPAVSVVLYVYNLTWSGRAGLNGH